MQNGWDERRKKNLQKGLRPKVELCYVTNIGGQSVEVQVLEPQIDYLPGIWDTEKGDVVAELLDAGEIE
jgi:hypothetical protein